MLPLSLYIRPKNSFGRRSLESDLLRHDAQQPLGLEWLALDGIPVDEASRASA